MDVLKDKIESLPKIYHIEIGKILNSYNIHLNENQNGIFVNLSKLSCDVIDKLNEYIKYIELQEKILNVDEVEKEELKDTYFTN
jgi:hypothetical protein